MGTNEGDRRSTLRLHVRLADVDADFLRFVPEDEREQARRLRVPAVELAPGNFDPAEVLGSSGGFYGVLLEGMVIRSARIGDQVAMRVLGPAAVIPAFEGPASEVFAISQWAMAAEGRIAVVAEEFLLAARRWPQLYVNLLGRIAEQTEQLVTQLALCQLPRVEDRLLAMLWLLTESWGKVTSAGTLLPLHFTHEALGAMVGARRSTVTLALAKLAERGAVVQRDGGWLLVEPPPQQLDDVSPTDPPELLELSPTGWSTPQGSADTSEERRALFALISRLREEHRRSVSQLQERLQQAEAVRNRTLEIRERVRQGWEHPRGRAIPPRN